MEKLKIPYPIIVEGKYDKIKLSSIIDADIFTTDGFGIFTSTEKVTLFRALAEKRGKIIILTDSDGGGTIIRSHLKSLFPSEKLINLYIPSVKGKEKRKKTPGKEGTLGVEGMETEIILNLLKPFADSEFTPKGDISKALMYEYGLTGGENSFKLREKLAATLGFPPKMTPNALLVALNVLYTAEEFVEICKNI